MLRAERPSSGDPKVYVLVVNWHGWADTIECLESVLRQDYSNFQVVVCDNGSQDGSLERIKSWAKGEMSAPTRPARSLDRLVSPELPKPVAHVEHGRAAAEAGGDGSDGEAVLILIQAEANLGFAGGNNVGIAYALARGDADYVWLLNNDTVVDPGALQTMVRLAQTEERIGMVGSKLMYYDAPDTIQAVAGGRVIRWTGMTRHLGCEERDVHQWDEVLEPEYITGASMLVRVRLVEAVGLMDERYFLYSEEVDWCLRARLLGWRLLYCPESRVWHKEGKTVRYKSPLHDYYTVRSSLLLVRKFYPHLLPLAAVYSVFRCLLPKVVRFQPTRLRAVVQAYRDFIAGSYAARPVQAGSGAAPTARA